MSLSEKIVQCIKKIQNPSKHKDYYEGLKEFVALAESNTEIDPIARALLPTIKNLLAHIDSSLDGIVEEETLSKAFPAQFVKSSRIAS